MDTAYDIGKYAMKWASDTISDARYRVEGLYGTEIERKVKEATSNENLSCSNTLKNEISQATFMYSDSLKQIMAIIWNRLDASAWRVVYKTLSLVEYILSSGSQRAIDELRMQAFRIRCLKRFYCVDSEEIDRGKCIRELAKKICTLLEDDKELEKVRRDASNYRRRMASQTGFSSDQNIGTNQLNSFGSFNVNANRPSSSNDVKEQGPNQNVFENQSAEGPNRPFGNTKAKSKQRKSIKRQNFDSTDSDSDLIPGVNENPSTLRVTTKRDLIDLGELKGSRRIEMENEKGKENESLIDTSKKVSEWSDDIDWTKINVEEKSKKVTKKEKNQKGNIKVGKQKVESGSSISKEKLEDFLPGSSGELLGDLLISRGSSEKKERVRMKDL